MAVSYCEEHYIEQSFPSGERLMPCAWPGCVNGTSSDTITETTIADDRIGWQWRREFVESFDGRRRYFWHAPDMIWAIRAEQLQNHEIERVRKLLCRSEYVHHYTTLTAFKSIVESQELWLTDYAYLNDSSEVQHGIELAHRVFSDGWSSATEQSRTAILAVLDTPIELQPRICVACFSFERDGLTQWKGYGRDQVGIAIGINPQVFMTRLGLPYELSFAPIIYDTEVKVDLLRGFAHDWAELRDRDIRDGLLEPRVYEVLPRGPLFKLLAMMKDEAFRDEREFRFVYQEDPRSWIAQQGSRAPKRFRINGSTLVPYTTTTDVSKRGAALTGQRGSLPLHEIIVGPHPHGQLIQNGIREFLDAHGYDTCAVTSKVPFR